MTGDELDRAIQFLLESQAKNDAQIARNDTQIARLTGDFAELRALVREFAESTRLFAERADERLGRLEQSAERRDRHLERLDKAMAELAEGMFKLGGLRKRPTSPDARDLRYKLLRPFKKVLGKALPVARTIGLEHFDPGRGRGHRLQFAGHPGFERRSCRFRQGRDQRFLAHSKTKPRAQKK